MPDDPMPEDHPEFSDYGRDPRSRGWWIVALAVVAFISLVLYKLFF
jgi:hypothetical protein